MTNSSTPGPSSATFRTTRWTQVLASRGDSVAAKTALSDLCAAYYAPVVAFLRAEGRDEDGARELAHAFFARVLERQSLGGADPARGRFRSYLLGALKHFLADARDRAGAAKRGGGESPLPLDLGTDTSASAEFADVNAPTPDREFDRKWAFTVLDRALIALAAEHADTGERKHFETLKPWLTGETEKISQADAARALSMNEGAVKVAIHRLRKRFRELVKAEIAQTLTDPEQVADELRHLIEVVR